MILESALTATALGGAYYILTKDKRAAAKRKQEIKETWNKVMSGLPNSNSSNKEDETYNIINIFIKEYGFNAIVSIPTGKDFVSLRKLLPVLEAAYGANIILELSKNKKTGYMRVHILNGPYTISDKDKIYFKWYKTFTSKDSYRNNYGETFNIERLDTITNPNDKEDIVGYKAIIQSPSSLQYSTLISAQKQLSDTFGDVFVKYDRDINKAVCEFITKPLDPKEKFVPIKVKPHQLYVGMSYAFKPIILDYKENPHLLIGGAGGTGKTVTIITAFLNLVNSCTPDEVQLFAGMVSAKQDISIFKELEHCKYYADNIDKCLSMLEYIIKESARRSKLFQKNKRLVFNVFDYNKYNKKNKLPIMHLFIDEITSFMKTGIDTKEEIAKKNKCMGYIWQLAREGRSAGIFLTLATQRGDIESLKAQIKSQMANKICFYTTNKTSAQTIFGDGSENLEKITLLKKKREALVEYAEGTDLMYSLYFPVEAMEVMLSNLKASNDNHLLRLDEEGNILDENSVIDYTALSLDEKDKKKQKNKNDKNEQESVKLTRKEKQNNRRKSYFAKKNKNNM